MNSVSEKSLEIKRLGEHSNAFGFLRLFFASLVIVSHTPELVDGNRHREPLEWATGTMSLGDLAVDGFFIISGYLIVGSFLKRPEIISYLRRRVARIYPGFITASLLSVLIVAPIAGASLPDLKDSTGLSLLRLILLQQPWVAHTFEHNANTQLNGPMWTIAYEFRCYLLVIILGACGAFKSWSRIAGLAILMLGLSELVPTEYFDRFDGLLPGSEELLGRSKASLHLTGMFLTGSVFFIKREVIKLTPKRAVASAVLLSLCFLIPALAVPGIALFGAYLIFAIAFLGKNRLLSRINNTNDISFGVYLYAWPAEQLLLLFFPAMPLLQLGLATFAIASLCGWISWHAIEKPMMQRLR